LLAPDARGGGGGSLQGGRAGGGGGGRRKMIFRELTRMVVFVMIVANFNRGVMTEGSCRIAKMVTTMMMIRGILVGRRLCTMKGRKEGEVC